MKINLEIHLVRGQCRLQNDIIQMITAIVSTLKRVGGVLAVTYRVSD